MNAFNEINTEENNTIVKTIHRFSLAAFIFSLLSGLVYFVLGLYTPSLIVISLGVSFLFIFYLNKYSHQILARILLIVICNLGVLYFSPYIGFNSGIYLYLFTAPQLIFLLFKRKQQGLIYFCMALNLVTCFAVYFLNKSSLIESIHLESGIIQILYSVNFLFSLIFSFILVSIFARNNDIYIDMLVDANQSLNNQQEILIVEIAEKNKINSALEKSIKEKEVLLSEVHHRVKNNLAVISGLLELENMFVKEKTVSDILKDSKNRIKSIALLHEKLYQHQNFEKIDIKNYVKELVDFIQLSYSDEAKNVTIESEVEAVFLSMELALPFSLLVNELITNSYKHAFQGRESGLITIRLSQSYQELLFEYSDNGVGFDLNESIDDDSIGMNLMSAFIDQLEGKLVNNTKMGEGCKVILHFKDQ